MLIRLLRSVVDPNPTLRHQMVSAIIAGGNVVVPTGKGNDGGGSFAHLMPCTSTGETGCVIAYSSFPGAPPANSYFGRAGQGVSLQSGQTQRRSLAVVCTNPAALGGGAANLTPYFIATTTSFPTLWLTYPNLYRAAARAPAALPGSR